MAQTVQLEVYTDGQCPLCLWMREKAERRDRFQRIDWKDYRDPEVRKNTPFTFEELDAEMHTRRITGGQWCSGFAAWMEVIRVLPRWRMLVPFLSVWPSTALGPLFYRWLAKRRYKLFGIPPPCDEKGLCSLHKTSER